MEKIPKGISTLLFGRGMYTFGKHINKLVASVKDGRASNNIQ